MPGHYGLYGCLTAPLRCLEAQGFADALPVPVDVVGEDAVDPGFDGALRGR